MDTCLQKSRSPEEDIVGIERNSDEAERNLMLAGGRDSDTESMEPVVEEDVETGVVPDSLMFNLPVYIPDPPTLSNSLPKPCLHSTSPAPAANSIMDSYEHFLHSANSFYQTSVDRVSELEQENEMHRLKEKDLVSQVKQLKEENFHLKLVASRDVRAGDMEKVLGNLRQAVERMHEYKQKYEHLAAQRGRVAGPDTVPFHHQGLRSFDDEWSVEPDTPPERLTSDLLDSAEEKTLTPNENTGCFEEWCERVQDQKAPEYHLIREEHASYLGKLLDRHQMESLLDTLQKLHAVSSHNASARVEKGGSSDHVTSEAIITWVRQTVSMATTENLVRALCRASLRPEAENFCKEFGLEDILKYEVDEA